MAEKLAGWTKNRQKFTKSEYKNSYLKDSGLSFKEYEKEFERQKIGKRLRFETL